MNRSVLRSDGSIYFALEHLLTTDAAVPLRRPMENQDDKLLTLSFPHSQVVGPRCRHSHGAGKVKRHLYIYKTLGHMGCRGRQRITGVISLFLFLVLSSVNIFSLFASVMMSVEAAETGSVAHLLGTSSGAHYDSTPL